MANDLMTIDDPLEFLLSDDPFAEHREKLRVGQGQTFAHTRKILDEMKQHVLVDYQLMWVSLLRLFEFGHPGFPGDERRYSHVLPNGNFWED